MIKQIQALFKHPYSMLYINQGLKISTICGEEYDKLLAFLDHHKVERFTYNAEYPTIIRFIKGLPLEVSNEKICIVLREKTIAVKTIQQMKSLNI